MRLRATIVLVSLLSLGLAPDGIAQKVTTVAGGFVGDGRAATQASFQAPIGIVQDRKGNTYVSDLGEQRIRKISATGTISTFAGTGFAGFSGDGGAAHLAKINTPRAVTIDAGGDIVFADSGNNRVRKITTKGVISTIAGNGTAGYSGDGGPATSASLNVPWGLTYDSAGNLYISDLLNNVIRKVDTAGMISTVVGKGTQGFCGDGGLATLACLYSPKGLAFDTRGGSLYIVDGGNHRIRQVNSAGIITTVAGNGSGLFGGDGGPAIQAAIGNPKFVTVNAGVLYISNAGKGRIRDVVLNTGIINTYIGSSGGYDGDNHAPLNTETDGTAGMVWLSSSSMLFVDGMNARVRRLSGGLVTTMAGGYIGDGNAATSAALVFPQSVAFDKSGNLYIAEWSGNRIRKVGTTAKISTVAGTGISGYSGDGGAATSAQLSFPQAAIADSAGNLFISDQGNNVIRKVDTFGNISTYSADPKFGGALGFMAFDSSGNLYVGDGGACVVWKVDATGTATAVAGVPSQCGYNGDNIQATTALLNIPYGIAFDSAGNLYISDYGNNRVREVSSSGNITTFAGDGTACASSTASCGDGGSATAAQLNLPVGLAVSGSTVYIADEGDVRIRKVTAGVITTYAGTGNSGYNGNGLAATSTNLDDPIDIAINPTNSALYLVDDIQARVRKVH
ncbi:MAG TPA: hypothetical protein VGS27_17875 [Candidatus Sulfotelmatobacter sp.]|nr:hypothetical protein [Candidatus Sulfotelmatobacter sp.]